MKNDSSNEKIFERLETFDKIIRMIKSCENLDQLNVCMNYFNQYKEWYFVSNEKQIEFERKFEEKKIILFKEKSKEENNEKNV